VQSASVRKLHSISLYTAFTVWEKTVDCCEQLQTFAECARARVLWIIIIIDNDDDDYDIIIIIM
jgi:hypothetical protein